MKYILTVLLCASLSGQVTLHPASTLRGQGRGHSGVGITGMSISPSSVVGTNSSTGTVTLNSTAGGTVSLSSSNSAVASVPATVTVPNGQTTAQFGITTTAVVSNTTVTITGNLSGMATANITVQAPTLQSISLNPSSVTGGSPSTGTATLTGPAPTGGETVTLSSSNTAVATVPASVLVPVGQQSANFVVSTTSGASTTATIIGTFVTQQSAVLTIVSGGGAAADTLPGTNVLGWQTLPNTALSTVQPVPNPGGTYAGVVYAWSSGFYDRTRRQMVVWGGGHSDYAGNEFYAIQLDANPATVRRLNFPSATTSTGCTNADGSPHSTHTYDNELYDPVDDLFVQARLASCWQNSDSSGTIWVAPRASFPDNPNTTMGSNVWVSTGVDATNNTGNPGPGAASGDFDPNTQLFYWSSANLTPGLFAFNPSATQTRQGIAPRSISTINGANSGCYDEVDGQSCTSVVDPVEKQLYQFGGRSAGGGFPATVFQFWNIDPTSGTYGAVTRLGTPTGCSAFVGGAYGADWDPVAQVFVLWPSTGPSNNQLYAFNPGSTARTEGSASVPAGQCVALNPPTNGVTVPAMDGGHNTGTHKRFRYVDYCDCFVLVSAYGSSASIVRTRTHTTPNLFVSRTAGVNLPGGSANLLLTSPLSGGQPMSSAVVQNCTNGGIYFGAPTPPNGSCNGTGWVLDSATVDADDAGQTNGSWNSVILAGQASSGNIFTNFSPTCCGSANNNAVPGFGLGQEFFVQYRVRYDANAISNANWPSGGGFKQDIVREEDHFVGQQITANACAGDSPSGIDTFNGVDEIVLQEVSPTTFNPNHPFIYTHCPPVNNSEISITNPQTGKADQIDQNAAGCYHGDPFTPAQCDGGWCANDPTGSPAGNCFDYHANDWMTVQKHIIIGSAWGQCCSKIEVWLAHDGQPSQLVISLSDWILSNDDPTNGRYGKLWNDLFNTGTTGAVATANVWYDNVIASKRRIPDPDVSVPNAPDNLTISNPGCSATPCSVTVNWRVNSQNRTAQDDEGMVVERAQVASGVSDWVPFANQNNSNSGGNFAVIATLPPGTASYTDTGLTKGTTYIYRVRARNTFGNSAYAASLCVRNGVGSSTPAQPWSPTPQNPCGGTVTP